MRLYIIRHADPDYEHDTITPARHLGVSDTSHLYAAGLPVLPRGLKGNIR